MENKNGRCETEVMENALNFFPYYCILNILFKSYCHEIVGYYLFFSYLDKYTISFSLFPENDLED